MHVSDPDFFEKNAFYDACIESLDAMLVLPTGIECLLWNYPRRKPTALVNKS